MPRLLAGFINNVRRMRRACCSRIECRRQLESARRWRRACPCDNRCSGTEVSGERTRAHGRWGAALDAGAGAPTRDATTEAEVASIAALQRRQDEHIAEVARQLRACPNGVPVTLRYGPDRGGGADPALRPRCLPANRAAQDHRLQTCTPPLGRPTAQNRFDSRWLDFGAPGQRTEPRGPGLVEPPLVADLPSLRP